MPSRLEVDMPVLQQLVRRFEELEKSLSTITWRPSSQGNSLYAPEDQWRGWASSAMHLIRAAFGETSPHYLNFKARYDACSGYDYDFAALKGIFLAASEDYRGGYVFSVEASISGEVLGDFVAMAKF